MIFTITVNPALDVNIDCSEIIRPTTIRTQRERRHAGGKGIDVSRVIRNLGGSSIAMGFLGGFTGRIIEGLLQEEGLELNFVRIAEETRINVIINAPIAEGKPKREHRFNSEGPKVQPYESYELYRKIKSLSSVAPERNPTHVAVCGSLAREMKGTYYTNIIRYFKDLGARVYLDTSGKAMKESLRFPPRPHVVKSKLNEFDELCNYELSKFCEKSRHEGESNEELLERMCNEDSGNMGPFWRKLLQQTKGFLERNYGVQALFLTLGESGILLVQGDRAYHGVFVPPASFKVVSTVGAGNTALAALILALEERRSWEESLKVAVAASAAAVTRPGTEAPDRDQVVDYMENVTVRAVSEGILRKSKKNISIVFNPGDTSQEEVVELISSLSNMYRSIGGDSLRIKKAGELSIQELERAGL